MSFVAVPAQPRAGTTKNYCEDKEKNLEPEETTENKIEKEKKQSKELELRMKMLDSFLFTQKEKEGI